jgi:hypothetical protein
MGQGFQVLTPNSVTKEPRRVYFTESGALTMGLGVCFDRDYTSASDGESATDELGFRNNAVALPDSTNNLSFAGVVAENYEAVPGGQWIMIYEPGSVVLARTAVTATIGNYLTCIVGGDDAGKFGSAGFMGRGTVRVLQTITEAGLVMAELLDGNESGLVETITTVAAGGAKTAMIGGVTQFTGVALTGDVTLTLANGVLYGQKKAFKTLFDYGDSKDVVITVTSGKQADDSTALASITMDDVGDLSVLEWAGDKWKLIHNTGSTLA